MNFLDACVSAIREHTMREGQKEVVQAIEHLKATRENFPLVVSDREWLFRFIVYRPDLRWKVPEAVLTLPDALFHEEITEEDIWQWMNAALATIPTQELPALPERAEKDLWCAVMIADKLYCCGCRSLYEGTPLTESQVFYLQDEDGVEAYCTECDVNL